MQQPSTHTAALREEKRALRAICAAKLALLPPPAPEEAQSFCNALRTLPAYRRAQTVFCFVSLPNEPPTRAFLQAVLADGKTLCAPWCAGRGVMYARRVACLEALETGVLGILAPRADAPTIPPAEIDFSVIPCVAADERGNRLGHGAGYYDRFLPKLATTAARVLLCRAPLLLPQGQIPVGPHDVPVPCVLTERGFAGQARE